MIRSIDNYDILEVIHSSKEGDTIVLKVREKKRKENARVYALKLIGSLNNRLQMLLFKREVEALRVLNSCGHIVKIRDHLTNIRFNGKDKCGAILLDYVNGNNLDELDLSRLSQIKKYELCLKVLCAVEEAHNNSVLHRDIKPSNIMYDMDTDQVTVIDFGTSKIKSCIDKETTSPFFSPNYSAPEVVAGNSISEASDIYSAGAVIFRLLFGICPDGSRMIRQKMEELGVPQNLMNLISGMTEENPNDRFQGMGEVIERFEELIGKNAAIHGQYYCSIDIGKLEYLKRLSLIEEETTMSIFTNSYLKKQFRDCHAYYDRNSELYVFSGDKIAINCRYDMDRELFITVKILRISVDRKITNQKRGFKLDGTLKFLNGSVFQAGGGLWGDSDNLKLIVRFKNHEAGNTALQKQNELFDQLFGCWKDGLDECIRNEKKKAGEVRYSDAVIEGRRLILTLDSYAGSDIDELTTDKQYIVEDVDSRGKSYYYELGTYHEVEYDEDQTLLIIDVGKRVSLEKAVPLLKKRKLVLEDFRTNIGSYKRQHRAIKALYDDDYACKNLKDIVLDLDEPTSTLSLESIQFSTEEFHISQKEAIRKALFSDSVSLIQGPPGTGKTKVIKEIIWQVLKRVNRIQDFSRILVVSQSHTAVDNIVEGLLDFEEMKLDIVRIGKEENLSALVAEQCTMPAIRRSMLDQIRRRSLEYMDSRDQLYGGLLNQEERERWEKIKEIQQDWLSRCSDSEALDHQIIKAASIVAGTCVGFLSNDYVKDLEFDYVIIDEAAKATTPELLVSIIKAKRIVLVGDQNQLPAYADRELSPIIAGLTKDPKYRLFDVLFDRLPETHKEILTMQYRMRRNIGDLISQVFYGGKITTGMDDRKREHGIEFFKGRSIVWISTSGMKGNGQSKRKGGSYSNNLENTIIRRLLEIVRDEGILDKLDIGIITGYRSQKELIAKSVVNSGISRMAGNMDVNTLDAFQGRENDIIIYSTVRTEGSIGFQKEKERVNVAFSRAKSLLIICGDLDFFYHFDDPDNKFIEIIDYINENKKECEIISGGDL